MLRVLAWTLISIDVMSVRSVAAALALFVTGCCTCPERPPPAVPLAGGIAGGDQPAPQVDAEMRATVRLQVNCRSICRNIGLSCRQACVPTSYSPNMRVIQDSCERQCDFHEFACVGDCRAS